MEEVLWGEAVADFLRGKATKAAKTRQYYDSRLRQLVAWAETEDPAAKKEAIQLQDFGARHFRRYMEMRSAAVSAQTQYHDAVAAKVFFRFCRQNKYTARDPLADFEFPKPRKPIIPLPTLAQIQGLLRAIETKWDIRHNAAIKWQDPEFRPFFKTRDYAIACLLIETGCRIDEGLRVKLADLKVEDGGSGGTITLRDTKSGRDREVPVGATFLAAIAPWLKIRRKIEAGKANDIARGQEISCGDTLFITAHGNTMKPNAFAKTWRSYLAFAGIERFTRHQVRHFTLTKVVKKNPRSAQLLAGHADISTTIRNYDHTQIDQVRADHTEVNPLGAVIVNKRSEAAKKKRVNLKG